MDLLHTKKQLQSYQIFEHQVEALATFTNLHTLAHNFKHTLIVIFMISHTQTYLHSTQEHHTYLNITANIPNPRIIRS